MASFHNRLHPYTPPTLPYMPYYTPLSAGLSQAKRQIFSKGLVSNAATLLEFPQADSNGASPSSSSLMPNAPALFAGVPAKSSSSKRKRSGSLGGSSSGLRKKASTKSMLGRFSFFILSAISYSFSSFSLKRLLCSLSQEMKRGRSGCERARRCSDGQRHQVVPQQTTAWTLSIPQITDILLAAYFVYRVSEASIQRNDGSCPGGYFVVLSLLAVSGPIQATRVSSCVLFLLALLHKEHVRSLPTCASSWFETTNVHTKCVSSPQIGSST